MNTDAFRLKEKCLELEAALLAKNPTMPTLLREIHTTLGKYSEQVTLMDEESIAIVVKGLMVQTGVEFAAAAASAKPSATKNLKNAIASKGADAF